MFKKNIVDRIFSVETEYQFEQLALEIFYVQAKHNKIYNAFIKNLKINIAAIKSINQIPFLPIAFFKTHEIKTGIFNSQAVFKSSGTTGSETSSHFVKDISVYEKSFVTNFQINFGVAHDFTFLSLLPSYLERQDSSLTYMMKKFNALSHDSNSGFYLNSTNELIELINCLNTQNKKHTLLGVTFALLDFQPDQSFNFSKTIIMDTGGMKGRKKEMIREEVHEVLKNKFGVQTIYSEYGMTELLSQCYSMSDGKFNAPPWMKIFIREPNDPMQFLASEQSGAINIIDLANLHSCAFIATDDLGKLNCDRSFSVSGRMDNSDLRGCNLLVV